MGSIEPLRRGDPVTLGGYGLTGRIGAGGQGVVLLGLSADGEQVAVKLLHAGISGNPKARHYFARELVAARQVDPFCTARILAADVEGAVPYIVSEYIPGPSLRDVVRERGPHSGSPLHRLAIGTATALTAIHQAGVVHRDFKPGNVILGPDGPRVIDFGIARVTDGATAATGGVVGTPAYMAPEQLRGAAPGPAADVFAWGATIVFAATGRAPFGEDTMAAVMYRVANEPPDLGALGGPLRTLVAGCLDKDPARRPSARQVLLRLLGHQDVPVRDAPLREGAGLANTKISPTTPTPPWRRTAPALLAAIAATAAIAAVVGYLLWPGKAHGTDHTQATPPAGLTWFEGRLGLPCGPAGSR